MSIEQILIKVNNQFYKYKSYNILGNLDTKDDEGNTFEMLPDKDPGIFITPPPEKEIKMSDT